MPYQPASEALGHLRVLDLTRVRAGPTCVRQLADWGADVIKVEMPPDMDQSQGMGGPRHGPDFQNLHRNKRSLTLNLKEQEGREIFLKLVRDADVVVENYRPDVKHRLKIDYESLAAVNPRLIYTSISGFGQHGPYAKRPGFDQIAQGMGGLMSITGAPGEGPMRAGIPIADLTAGLFAAQGIFIALLERERSGKGQWVQTSLLEAQIFMLDFQAARWLVAGDVPGQAGNDHPTSIPTGVFETADGYINIAASGEIMWQRLAKLLDAEAWLDNPDYKGGAARSKNRKQLNAEIAEKTRTITTESLVRQCNDAGIPCGPIYSIKETFADPHVQHLGMAAPVNSAALGTINLVKQPISLSRTPTTMAVAPPEAGEHTDEILQSLGYDSSTRAALKQHHIV